MRGNEGDLTRFFDRTVMGASGLSPVDSIISLNPFTSKLRKISPPIFWKSSAKALQTTAQSTIPVHGDHRAFSP